MKMLFLSLLAVFALAGCSRRGDADLDYALGKAGSNRDEIERALAHWEDGDKRAAAEWLVAAMIGRHAKTSAGIDSIERLYDKEVGWYFDDDVRNAEIYASMPQKRIFDLQSVSAQYLINDISDAHRLWKSRKWNSELPCGLFCELLLPYRIGDEVLTDWRPAYREWLGAIEDSIKDMDSSVDAARVVASAVGVSPYNDQFRTPHRSALRLIERPIGYCREDCDRTVYAMRAFGIPVGIDIMPVSPDNGASHMWNVVYDNIDGRFRMFDNSAYLPTRDSAHYDHRRRGKVYRQMFGSCLPTIEKYKEAKNAPPYLANPHLQDVTAEYFGHNKAETRVWAEEGDVYLGLMTNGEYKPIDLGRRKGGYAAFADIEPEVIYFPITLIKGRYEPCGVPFMLHADGTTHMFCPNHGAMSRVVLTRKYPMRYYQWERVNSIVGVQVQASASPSGPWRTIFAIGSPAKNNFVKIPLAGPITDRYIRLYKENEGKAELGQLIVSNDSLGLDPRRLEICGDSATREKYRNLADGDILSRKGLRQKEEDLIFHICDGKPIEHLFLVPANDDNYVLPAQEYELLYFSDAGWKSLGRKASSGFSLEFSAPDNAVLLLRNHTKGREEQPFIYQNGKQLFSIDLKGNSEP